GKTRCSDPRARRESSGARGRSRQAPFAELLLLDEDRVFLYPQTFDRDLDGACDGLKVRGVDRLPPLARLERRAERDDVAGQQRVELADEAHDLGDLVVVVPRAVFGDQLAADLARHGQVVGICDLVLGDEPRAHRAERVGAFVAAGIRQVLLDTFRLVRVVLLRVYGPVVKPVLGAHAIACDVVEDRVAVDRVERARRRHVARRPADDDRELGLWVNATVVAANADRLAMADEARGRLQEERGMIRRADLALVARGVVHRDRADLPRAASPAAPATTRCRRARLPGAPRRRGRGRGNGRWPISWPRSYSIALEQQRQLGEQRELLAALDVRVRQRFRELD